MPLTTPDARKPLFNRLPEVQKDIRSLYFGYDVLVDDLLLRTRRWAAGRGPTDEPFVKYFLTGLTGTGKSLLAEAYAHALYEDKKMFVDIAGNTFQDASDCTRWIGAGARWIGREDPIICSNAYLNRFRRDGLPLIYRLDEIGVSHKAFQDLHLGLLETGAVTNAVNEDVSWVNTAIFMTSNDAQDEILKWVGSNEKPVHEFRTADTEKLDARLLGLYQESLQRHLDRQNDLNRVVAEVLLRKYKPQFVNRFDMIVGFEPFSEVEVTKVARLSVALKLHELGFNNANIADQVIQQIVFKCHSDELGLRPLKRFINSKIAGQITDMLIAGTLEEGDNIALELTDSGEIEVIRRQRSIAASTAAIAKALKVDPLETAGDELYQTVTAVKEFLAGQQSPSSTTELTTALDELKTMIVKADTSLKQKLDRAARRSR